MFGMKCSLRTMSAEQTFLQSHTAHDPGAIVDRWRTVAAQCGLSVSSFAKAGDEELFVVRSQSPEAAAPRVYLSAGIHGDEPGAPLGLLHWAEANLDTLRALNVLIFPVMNPAGLRENTRHDAGGRDLNRLFQTDEAPFPEWRRALGDGRFDLSICLHEDFDARGSYIYELGLAGLAERVLAAGDEFIPPDPSEEIEDIESVGGVIRHGDMTPEEFPLDGLPEAVWIFFNRCPVSLNLETPSEYSLWARVNAHAAMVGEAVRARFEEHPDV